MAMINLNNWYINEFINKKLIIEQTSSNILKIDQSKNIMKKILEQLTLKIEKLENDIKLLKETKQIDENKLKQLESEIKILKKTKNVQNKLESSSEDSEDNISNSSSESESDPKNNIVFSEYTKPTKNRKKVRQLINSDSDSNSE